MTKISNLSDKELKDRLQAMRGLSQRGHWAYDSNVHRELKDELDRRSIKRRKVA